VLDALDTMFSTHVILSKGIVRRPGAPYRSVDRCGCRAHRQISRAPARSSKVKEERYTMSRNNTATPRDNTVHNENNFEIERSNVEFASCGSLLKGVLLTTKGKREALPTIVMACRA
jgi:hypothetical protein